MWFGVHSTGRPACWAITTRVRGNTTCGRGPMFALTSSQSGSPGGHSNSPKVTSPVSSSTREGIAADPSLLGASRPASPVDDDGVHRAEQPLELARAGRQLAEAVRARLSAVAPLALPPGDRDPETIDDVGRISGDLVLRQAQVLAPEAQPRAARERGVADLDVDLRVVEERMRVEVGRADRQPPVVDDADLRVDVEAVDGRPGHRVDRRGEEAPAPLVRIGEMRQHPPRVLLAVVRLGR